MHRSCAAESDQTESSRIESSADGEIPDQASHTRVDDIKDSLGQSLGGESQPRRQVVERIGGKITAKLHPPAEEVVGVNSAEVEIGIGHCRLNAASGVAG